MKKINFLLILTMLMGIPIVLADLGDCSMGNMMIGNYGFGMMGFSWLIGILVIIALVLLIIWLFKQIQKK